MADEPVGYLLIVVAELEYLAEMNASTTVAAVFDTTSRIPAIFQHGKEKTKRGRRVRRRLKECVSNWDGKWEHISTKRYAVAFFPDRSKAMGAISQLGKGQFGNDIEVRLVDKPTWHARKKAFRDNANPIQKHNRWIPSSWRDLSGFEECWSATSLMESALGGSKFSRAFTVLQIKETLDYFKKLRKKYGKVQAVGVGPALEDANQASIYLSFGKAEQTSLPKFTAYSEKEPLSVTLLPIGEVQPILNRRHRPVLGGCSVSKKSSKRMGSITCLAMDEADDPVVVSASHVLTNDGSGEIGDEIVQPGSSDEDVIGHLAIWTDLKGNSFAQLDAAHPIVSDLEAANGSGAAGRERTVITGIADPQRGEDVTMFGQASGDAKMAKLEYVHRFVRIPYANGMMPMIGPLFSAKLSAINGDSGACVLDNQANLIGLVVASTTFGHTFCHPIVAVFGAHKLKLS